MHCFLVTLHVEEDIQREREREREKEELRGKRREAKGNERCPRIEFVSKGCLECLRETKKKIHRERERKQLENKSRKKNSKWQKRLEQNYVINNAPHLSISI